MTGWWVWLMLWILLGGGAPPALAQRTTLMQEDVGVRIATHFGAGACNAATLNAAISAIGSTPATLDIPPMPRNSVTPCTWTLTSNVIVPANIRLTIPRGVMLSPAAGITFTMAHPPESGPYQIFDANGTSTGTVTFTTAGLVHAEWWGARGDNSTDSAVAITQAVNSGVAMTVQLQGGVFRIGSPITPPVNDFVGWTIQGVGRIATILRRTTGFTGTIISIGTNEAATRITRVRTLGIDCIDRAVGTKGIRLQQAPWFIAEDIDVSNCEYGIHQSGGIQHVYRDLMLDNNVRCFQLDNDGADGGKSAVGNQLYNVQVRECTLYGVNLDGSFSATQLVRETSLYNLMTDREVAGGGNTCVRIHGAERVWIYGAHFEQCDPMLAVSTPAGKLTQHVQLYGAAMGDLNETNAGAAIVWNTPEDGGGLGSALTGLRVKEGTSTFTSDHIVSIRNGSFPGNAPPTGDGFSLRNNDNSVDDVYSKTVDTKSWTHFKAEKRMPTHNAVLRRRFATENTTDAQQQPLFVVRGPPNTSHLVEASILGKRQDNSAQAAYHATCLFFTNNNSSVTTLVSSSITPVLESAGATGWEVTCQGETTTPGCAFMRVYVDHNAAGYTVRWAGTAEIIHMTQDAGGPALPECDDPEDPEEE